MRIDLSDNQIQRVAKNIDTITDLERIGDHFDNLFEFFQERKEKKMILHQQPKMNIAFILHHSRTTGKSTRCYFSDNHELALEITKKEEELDQL